jgi:hypothetical protein
MLLLAWLLLQAVTSVPLLDEVYVIPANDWRFVPLGLNQRPALVIARFEVSPPPQKARLELMTDEELLHLQAGQPHADLSSTPFLSQGTLVYNVPMAGDYVIVMDNRDQPPARVRLRVRLDFPAVTQLPREKQLAVILISFAAFFVVVTWSARRLLRNMRR